MDRAYILDRLKSKKPLFEEIPAVSHLRICGTESEYGVADESFNPAVMESKELPAFFPNGGLLYHDCHHLEYASPETADAVSAVAYHEAGKVIAWRGTYCERLFCHNNDLHGNTFGAHESYFTSLPRGRWDQLVPFLIARTVITGNGWFVKHDRFTEHVRFELSQRARHITCASSDETTNDRALVNIRKDSLAKVLGFDRLHLICGDANMSEVSTFLKIGITSLFIEMLEMRALPQFQYDESKVVRDVQAVSQRESEWYMEGLKAVHIRGVVDFLGFCLTRAEELFTGRDIVSDAVLIIWRDTLEKLASDPILLESRLDWVAKRSIITHFMEHEENWTAQWLQSQDMEYHNLNPDEGLYLFLRQQGRMERIVSDDMIEHAVVKAPTNTRACLRGKLVECFLRMAKSDPSGKRYSLQKESWLKLIIVSQNAADEGKSEMFPNIVTSASLDDSLVTMSNPFCTYDDRLERIIASLH